MPYIVSDKVQFLAEASKILASTLDYNVTLAIIAKLIVTSVADFCIIDIFDGRNMKRLAVNVSDTRKYQLARRVFDFKPDPRNKGAIYDTAKLGGPIIIKKATKTWLNQASRIPEEREVIQQLGLNSHLFVPLKSRGEIIGVLTLASTDKNFSYSPEDAVFIEELANRAGTAVDKAQLYLEAQEALRTRDEFLSVASHELKTPLTSILLNLQAVLRKIDKTAHKTPELKDIVKMLEVSKSQSQRMSRLINDLLNVSVASTGRLKIETENAELCALIKNVLSTFKAQLKSKGIAVEFNPDYEIWGKWDRIRIEQVLSNLLSNAIKYGRGRPIQVTLFEKNNMAIIKVKDHGIGITKGDEVFIFDRFKRGVSSKEFSGLGVGLYISKQIIDAHNGFLYVESSNREEGTTFVIETTPQPLVLSGF